MLVTTIIGMPILRRNFGLLAGAAAGLGLALQTPVWAQAATAPGLSLQDVLRAAGDSLETRIARQASAGAAADILTADHAPLPILSSKLSQIDLQNGLGSGDWVGRKRVDKSIGVDWTWERGGKRELRTRAAQRTAAAIVAEAQELQLQQMLTAQAAYFDWLAARERLQLMRGIESTSLLAVQVAQKRLAAGDLAKQDVTRIEIDAARVSADRTAAELDLTRSSITLSQLTGRGDIDAVSLQPVDWPVMSGASADPAVAIDDRADVRAARERRGAAQVAVESARALQKVDPTWGISFDHFPGTSTRQVELRVQIPLTFGYKFQGEAERAQSDLRQSELTEERVLRDARGEVARLRAESQALERRRLAYEQDVLPRAAEVAQQAEFAYGRGATSLTDLIDARRTLRTTQLDALTTRGELAKARTALLLRTDPDRALAGAR